LANDIAWIRPTKTLSPRLNPEAGFFGVAPALPKKRTPTHGRACEEHHFHEMSRSLPDGGVWWEA